MYLCYVDESGNTGGNLQDINQPKLLLGAVLVPMHRIKEIEDDLRVLAYRHFAAESRNTDFEFHGDAIYNARGRYFKKLTMEKRIEILSDLVELAVKYVDLKLGYVSIQKAKYFARPHIQQTAFSMVVERLEEHLARQENAYCVLVADEQNEIEQKLIDDLDHYKQHGTRFGYKSVQVERIIDSVHFVQSKNNLLMQLCDVICYIIRKGKESDDVMMKEFLDLHQTGPKQSYKDWVENYPHRGRRYFSFIYQRLSSKGWIFTKDWLA